MALRVTGKGEVALSERTMVRFGVGSQGRVRVKGYCVFSFFSRFILARDRCMFGWGHVYVCVCVCLFVRLSVGLSVSVCLFVLRPVCMFVSDVCLP